jgi:hypothetical protein
MQITSALDAAHVTREQRGAPFTVSIVLALLMAMQGGLGMALPELYRDAGYVRETWFGNDLVTLALAVPVLATGLLLDQRDYVLGRLLWLGGLGYGAYNYAFYLFGAALNVFLPLYIVLVLLSVVSLILALARTEPGAAAARFSPHTPVRLIGGYLVFVALGLSMVWLGMWAAYVFANRPTPVTPDAFKVVAALDLSVMVPALATGGLLLWRRRPWGYVIAAIAGIQGSLYLAVLALNSLLFIVRGLAEAPGELPVWGTLVITMSLATILLLTRVQGRWHDA